MQKTVYSVILDGDFLKCIDTSNGVILGAINILGEVASGPIVTDDRCTVVIKNNSGRKGKVFKLPSFMLSSSFDA